MAVNYLTIIVLLVMLLTVAGTSSFIAKATNPGSLLKNTMEQVNKHLGMWVTADGYIRLKLFPDGRYYETHGNGENSSTGRYEISGKHIKYWDDNGVTAAGDFSGNGKLYHEGHVFYRESSYTILAG